jgi:hypothetical protein
VSRQLLCLGAALTIERIARTAPGNALTQARRWQHGE